MRGWKLSEDYLWTELQDPVRTSLISWPNLKHWLLPPGGATTITSSPEAPLQELVSLPGIVLSFWNSSLNPRLELHWVLLWSQLINPHLHLLVDAIRCSSHLKHIFYVIASVMEADRPEQRQQLGEEDDYCKNKITKWWNQKLKYDSFLLRFTDAALLLLLFSANSTVKKCSENTLTRLEFCFCEDFHRCKPGKPGQHWPSQLTPEP